MYQQYKDRVSFLFVYIQEAHPEDGWQTKSNQRDAVLFSKAKTLGDRQHAATRCRSGLKLTMPCVVDSLDNRVDHLYAGWPERMFVIDPDGKIAYSGAQGPWGFKTDEVVQAVKKLLRNAS